MLYLTVSEQQAKMNKGNEGHAELAALLSEAISQILFAHARWLQQWLHPIRQRQQLA